MVEKGKKFSKIVNSSLAIALGFAISGFLSILTRIVLGRFLEPAGYGTLSEGLAVLNFFIMFALLGTDQGVARFVSYNEDREKNTIAALAACIPLSLILTALVFFSADTIALLLNSEELESIIKVFSLNIPAYTVLSIIISGFRGEKRTKEKVFLGDTLLPLAILILSAPLAFFTASPALTSVGYLMSGWIICLIGAFLYIKDHKISFPSFDRVKEIIGFSFPLIAGNYAGFGLTWANIILLGHFIGSESAGFYNAALPISFSLVFALNSINYIFLPLTSSSHSKNKPKETREMYKTVVRWLTAVSLPLLFILVLKPDFIIESLFGSSYAAAAVPLAIISIGRFVDVFFGPLGQILIGIGETKKEAYSKLLGLLALLISSILLIPTHEVIGASIGFLIGFSTANILRFIFVRREIKINPVDKDTFKPFIAAILSIPFLAMNFENIVYQILSIAGFGLTYTILLIALKPLKPVDLETFKEVAESANLNPKLIDKSIEVLGRCK